MIVAADHVGARLSLEHRREPQERGHDPLHRPIDVGLGERAVRQCLVERHRPLLAERHLDVEARHHRTSRIAKSEDEVGGDEAVPAPLVAQDLGEQMRVVAAPLAVDRVVGAHHRRHPAGGDPFEVREIHLVERPFVDGHVDGEPGVLHRVQRKVLHARHHVPLQPGDERRRHHAHVVRVLPVRLLRPSPRRVTQQVHAHRAGVGGAARSQLGADRVTDAGLEVGIEARATCHAHRERRRVADDAAPRTVGEVDPGNTEPLDVGCRPRDGGSSRRRSCRSGRARTVCHRRDTRAAPRSSSARRAPQPRHDDRPRRGLGRQPLRTVST